MTEIEQALGPTTTAIVKDSRRVTPESTEEVRHIVLNVPDPAFRFVEGQSVAVVVPGPHPFGNPFHVRRYSIANARQLPVAEGVDLDLLVRRCFYIDEVSGERYPGIASNYLCDVRPGDNIQIAGPYVSPFRMPADNRSNLLMVGTGTGVAPFRAFMQYIYAQRGDWVGQVRLFYGSRTGLETLYMNEEQGDLANYYDEKTFKAFQALSKPLIRTDEQALEQSLDDHSHEVWDLVQQSNTYVFLAGLDKIAAIFDRIMAQASGAESRWAACKRGLIEEKRWSELIYS